MKMIIIIHYHEKMYSKHKEEFYTFPDKSLMVVIFFVLIKSPKKIIIVKI